MSNIETFIQRALTQAGKPYRYGFEVNLNDPNPAAFDCSELLEWAAHQAGGVLPDGSSAQFAYCQQHNTLIPVAKGLITRGALLFRMNTNPRHVAVSLGDGTTIEARGSAYGVGSFGTVGRGWTHAATVPGFDYQKVRPMFDPPLSIVSWCSIPGGVAAVAPDGAVFCEPASLYQGGPNGQPYWGSRRAARIAPGPAGKVYTITATTGETYSYPV